MSDSAQVPRVAYAPMPCAVLCLYGAMATEIAYGAVTEIAYGAGSEIAYGRPRAVPGCGPSTGYLQVPLSTCRNRAGTC